MVKVPLLSNSQILENEMLLMNHFNDISQNLYVTKNGNFWLPIDDYNDEVIRCIKNNHMFEDYVVEACKKYIEPGSTVIDVGANFGQMSLQWSKLVGENGYVHAFECSDFISYFLKKTIEKNDFAKNVKVHTNAVWNVSGVKLDMLKPDGSARGRFYSGMGIKAENQDPRMMPTHEVISVTLDDIEYQTRVSVIKVDAQGSDFFVLKGAKETILKHKPMIIFEYEKEYDEIFKINFSELHKYLIELGYELRPDVLNNEHDFVYLPVA